MAVTLAARDIGTALIGEHRIRVQRRNGSTGVWMTLLGRREFDDESLGVIADLDTDTPHFQIFQRFGTWDTPASRALLLAAVWPLYRDDEASHAGA